MERAEAKDDSPEEVLKCNLLVFLQENVMYFLAENAQRCVIARKLAWWTSCSFLSLVLRIYMEWLNDAGERLQYGEGARADQ